MATMHRVRRPKTMRLVLLGVMAAVLGVALAWSAFPAAVSAPDAPATPGNESLDSHPWGELGCTLPGAGIDSVPGLFDFRHACTHHDGCYQGFDRAGGTAVIDRARCDELAAVRRYWLRSHQHDPASRGSMEPSLKLNLRQD